MNVEVKYQNEIPEYRAPEKRFRKYQNADHLITFFIEYWNIEYLGKFHRIQST